MSANQSSVQHIHLESGSASCSSLMLLSSRSSTSLLGSGRSAVRKLCRPTLSNQPAVVQPPALVRRLSPQRLRDELELCRVSFSMNTRQLTFVLPLRDLPRRHVLEHLSEELRAIVPRGEVGEARLDLARRVLELVLRGALLRACGQAAQNVPPVSPRVDCESVSESVSSSQFRASDSRSFSTSPNSTFHISFLQPSVLPGPGGMFSRHHMRCVQIQYTFGCTLRYATVSRRSAPRRATISSGFLPVSFRYFPASSRVREQAARQDMPPVVPHSVELGVQVEQLRRLLQRLWRVVLGLFLTVSYSHIYV